MEFKEIFIVVAVQRRLFSHGNISSYLDHAQANVLGQKCSLSERKRTYKASIHFSKVGKTASVLQNVYENIELVSKTVLYLI